MSSYKTYKNKNKNKNKRTQRFGSAIPNQIYAQSFPRQMKISLRYSDTNAKTSSSTLFIDHVYNLNSIFDPDRTGTGHQPQGHDVWAQLYNRYRVDACTVKVVFTNSSPNGTRLGLLGSNDATAITDGNILCESPFGVHKNMTSTGPAVSLIKRFDLAALTGISRPVYNAEERYSAIMGANPGEVIVAHVGGQAEASFTFYYSIDMEFEVTLFDPVQLPTS